MRNKVLYFNASITTVEFDKVSRWGEGWRGDVIRVVQQTKRTKGYTESFLPPLVDSKLKPDESDREEDTSHDAQVLNVPPVCSRVEAEC